MAPRKNLQEHFDDGTLDLSLSDLQEVPVRDIAAIPKATTLDLSNNRIITIPKSFPSSLTHLVKLDLCQNQLTELPDNFGLLVHLKHLDLYSNKITSLPLSFGNLKALRWLDLKQNPLMPKLAEIAGPCLDASQCQMCAKNVVAMLNTMQSQVEAERLRRQEQRQKQLEQNELKAQAQKADQQQQQQKKKKKKSTNTSNKVEVKENGTANGDSENKTDEKKDVAKKNKPVTKEIKSVGSKIASFWSNVLKIIVIVSLTITFIKFVPLLLDQNTNTYIETKWRYAVHETRKALPVSVVKQLDILFSYFKNPSGYLLKQLQFYSVMTFEWLTATYNNMLKNEKYILFFKYMENLQEVWQLIWIKLCELCRTSMSYVL